MFIFRKAQDFLIKYISQLMLIYMVVIFIFSVIPSFDSGLNSGFSTHAVVYSILSILMMLNLKVREVPQPWLKGVFLAGTFGLLMEILQYFIPYRRFEVEDIILNYTSAIIALLPGYFIIKQLHIKPSKP
jgi:VanZ family protein